MTQDAPIFDPATWGLTEQQAELSSLARKLGQEKFAPRAAKYDREASFPFANYDDMRDSGLLALCVPEAHGGQGADYATYAMVSAEIGRWCGATALTFNMHVCTMMWSGLLSWQRGRFVLGICGFLKYTL